jgi:hypothetical protein
MVELQLTTNKSQNAEQGGQPERRIGRFVKSMVLGRRRVTLNVRLQRTHQCDVADSDCIPVRGGLNSSLMEAANDD